MKPIFFSFTNPATYHFFRWLTENNPNIDTMKLVLESIDSAPTDEFFELGEDISRSAVRVLARRLGELIEDLLDQNHPDETGNMEPTMDGSNQSLLAILA